MGRYIAEAAVHWAICAPNGSLLRSRALLSRSVGIAFSSRKHLLCGSWISCWLTVLVLYSSFFNCADAAAIASSRHLGGNQGRHDFHQRLASRYVRIYGIREFLSISACAWDAT